MTQSMIEKVVEVIQETAEVDQIYPECGATLLNPDAVARAVLEALMEPTDGMKEAWFDAKVEGRDTYRAMVQAAIEGK